MVYALFGKFSSEFVPLQSQFVNRGVESFASQPGDDFLRSLGRITHVEHMTCLRIKP